jgi:cytoplasmic FMR1 interacting protein
MLQVFQIALKDILQYPDMKPEVFQTLRDVGNSFVFMQLLDTASRTAESSSYMQYAPFIGTPTVSTEAAQGGTPLYRTVCAMVDKLIGMWPGSQTPPWSTMVTFDDVRRCAQCAESLANEAARQVSTSYFKAAIVLMNKFCEPIRQEVMGGGALPTDGSAASQGFVDAEGTLEFHRLYSAIQFLCCEETPNEPDDLAIFGEGLAWGGCVFIHVLGQKQRFNLLDYSYQLVKMADQYDAQLLSSPDVAKFVGKAREARLLNQSIFDQLNSAMPKQPAHAHQLPLPIPHA